MVVHQSYMIACAIFYNHPSVPAFSNSYVIMKAKLKVNYMTTSHITI